jgi:hypothetical protein
MSNGWQIPLGHGAIAGLADIIASPAEEFCPG